ncbi:MAG: RsmD family RNA methyltransferase [Desulfocapsaceae bacterium]|nr:RsmD family RNA methyltransferase [Desulfocapsaceae bacterium]
MRIISGHARGLKLKAPHGQAIRPTSDRAKEALFSIIGYQVREAFVLDLFAGTGALGLEALSRGARHVTFVDKSPDALMLIKMNIALFQKSIFPDSSRVPPLKDQHYSRCKLPVSLCNCDLTRDDFFNKRERIASQPFFDLIFLDPPYEKGLCFQTLTYIDKCTILAENGLIIAEDRAEVLLPDTFDTLRLVNRRRYGDAGFWFYNMK